MFKTLIASVLCAFVSTTSASAAEVVFQTNGSFGFFTPFNSGNAGVVKYGDSGWLGGPGAAPVRLGSITLGLATFQADRAGTTDIVLTLNDGDPSGLVFGTGAQLYQTVIRGVTLPATPFPQAEYFTLEVPLPGVWTLGGFNNIGWSVALENFDFDGQFGFQVGACFDQIVGFYTNNASYFDGSSWSLFSFGDPPCVGIAQFAATITLAPPVIGDLNNDGVVNGADLAIVLGSWGPCDGCPADFDGNGTVDGADLAVVLGNWTL